MPTRVIFRCEFCRLAPDPLTQLALERQLRELAFGEYLEVPPGPAGWCGSAAARSVRAATPAPSTAASSPPTCASTTARSPPTRGSARRTRPAGARADTERAIRNGGLSSMPKWGFG